MDSFGQYLKTEREKQGIALEEIASITKIQLYLLKLMEEDRWKELPPEPFIRGFIQAYAKYLDLNLQDVMDRFREESRPASSRLAPEPSESEPEKVMQRPRSVSFVNLAVAFAGTAFVVAISVLVYVGKKSSDTLVQTESPVSAISPNPSSDSSKRSVGDKIAVYTERLSDLKGRELDVPAAVTASPDKRSIASLEALPLPTKEGTKPLASVNKPAKIADPEKTKAEKTTKVEIKSEQTPAETELVAEVSGATPVASRDNSHTLIVEASDKTWVKWVVDDKPPKETVLNKGERSEYLAAGKIKVVLGNAAVAKVSYNGEQVKGDKLNGTIRSFVYPLGSRFPQDPPKKPLKKAPPPELLNAKVE